MKSNLKTLIQKATTWGMTDMSCFLSTLLKPVEHALCSISDKSYSISVKPVDSILIINFDRKLGGVIEDKYPSGTDGYESVINLSLPEGIHNSPTEHVFFMVTIKGANKFCIAFYRQIPCVLEGKRVYIQKAITVVSNVPFFGAVLSHIEMATREYFESMSSGSPDVLMKVYVSLEEVLEGTTANAIYQGISVKRLLKMFGEKLLKLWKLILLEKRIIIFDQSASRVSSFILALLSLFPGQLMFDSKHSVFRPYRRTLDIYGLPLKFSANYAICPFLSLSEINSIENEGYLIGCTNRLIIDQSIAQPDAVVNLEERQIILHTDNSTEKALRLSPYESVYMRKTIGRAESNERIREEFHTYLKDLLCNFAYIRKTKATSTRQNTENYSKSNSKKVSTLARGAFLLHWSTTENFSNWHSTHPTNLSYLSPYSELSPMLHCFYENGDQYIGPFCNGLRHGQGILEDSSGNRYEGSWVFGKKHGIATYTSCDKRYIYDGYWENDQKTGHASEIKDKVKYTGNFLKGKYHKNGSLVDCEGNWYSGGFSHNKKQGYGELGVKSGLHFKGELLKGRYHGQGRLSLPNGEVYTGSFFKGEKSGLGELHCISGEKYRGEFECGKYHGKGILQLVSGLEIYGIFLQGAVIREYCVLKYLDGKEYNGQINEEFLPDGEGKMKLSTGELISGRWVCGNHASI